MTIDAIGSLRHLSVSNFYYFQVFAFSKFDKTTAQSNLPQEKKREKMKENQIEIWVPNL